MKDKKQTNRKCGKKFDPLLLCGNCGKNYGQHIKNKCPRWGLTWSPAMKLIKKARFN